MIACGAGFALRVAHHRTTAARRNRIPAMRYCRFVHRGQPKYGLIETENTRDFIVRAIATMPRDYNPFAGAEPLHLALDEAELLAAVVPSKIICIGRNYAAHAKELGNE